MSSTARETRVSEASPSSVTPISKREAKGSLSMSVGISVTRSALPQRSPRPPSVPWIWRAPASTAASDPATALPVSSWVWMPSRSPGIPAAITSATTSPIRPGSIPPLVSQSTTQRAPASSAAWRQSSA